MKVFLSQSIVLNWGWCVAQWATSLYQNVVGSSLVLVNYQRVSDPLDSVHNPLGVTRWLPLHCDPSLTCMDSKMGQKQTKNFLMGINKVSLFYFKWSPLGVKCHSRNWAENKRFTCTPRNRSKAVECYAV